ncbi:hypothetical protein DYB38_007436 [Aphanomyces astaci]|uniref:Endonuclease/exonuclease/phosphatase domain-containing protein n=2 Tax=Aphanomyces astaci TaxID=112090 RepID=A0A397D2A1_APHAT|nr:hypothetical protein DYB38_007436 [Aphanomyces astaci]
MHTARIQRDNVLRRETLEGEAYIGDAGSTPTLDMQVDSLRIAATNINKNTYGKLSAELATWFRANALDFLIIADSDLPAYKATQLWTPAHGGTHAPSLMAVSNHRVSLLYDIQRWHSRIDARCTIYSPSGRSIAITLRLGKGTLVTLIGTYCQDNPAAHKEATDREWQWLAQAATRATGPHHFVVMGGDFNTYGPNPLDRLAPTPRASPSNDIGIAFQQWTQGIGLVSSFRHRHPNLQRHTYARNNTSVALDDIYISARTAHKVGASGIWLHTIHSSDHEGTPYMALDLCPGDHTPTRLTGVKPIRVVNTRNLAKADIASFGVHTSQLLSEGKLPQLTPAPPPNADTAWSPQEIGDWLDGAIRNLYDILYNSAKLKWGETSQTRKALNRAVAIQRTNRCTAQLRQLLRLHEAAPRTGTEYNRLAHLVEWPKWIRDPNLLPPTCWHRADAIAIGEWWTTMPTTQHPTPDWDHWLRQGLARWTKVCRKRRDWRTTSLRLTRMQQRTAWFNRSQTRKFLRSALGNTTPPISIQSVIVRPTDGPPRYSSNRDEVAAGLRHLLDNWIPPGEKTTRPRHLDTGLETDRQNVPHFVREWLLQDMDRPDEVAQAFQSSAGTTWDTYHYDEDMQARCDSSLRTRVSPGYGGVSQELWIAAPACIRARERVIINLILRTGLVPPILGRKQMIYLAKSDTAHGVVNLDPGLPPWRPITVQSALSSRIFTVIRDYITPCIPNHEMQHGFQRDRTVQDAAVLTTLLIERAERRQEELFLISKDCLKCFDRIPGWVMEYIYRKLGVPPIPRQLMAHFLGASQIDIRTAFGWLDGGIREFGLGQGSILAVMHIGYYMDVLLRQQHSGLDPVRIVHSQHPQGARTRTISSLLFVDDALDIATTYAGIQDRARISNTFTGQSASGGVFGADKSFLLYLSPHAHPAIALNDGLGVPQPIRVVAPSEGFRHLGIHQGTDNQWEETTRAVWQRLNTQADAVAPRGLRKKELVYIINSVWIPSVLYRTAISDAISIAPALDTLFRKTARRVLKLPHDHPTEWFYDPTDGLGLVHCERFSHSQRLYHFLRIANDQGSPTHDLLMESLEAYQLDSGLTDHPLAFRIHPPAADGTLLGTMLRDLATFQPALSITTQWHQPAASRPLRPNDRPIWAHLTPALSTTLISINKLHAKKVRWVGDITNDKGTMLLSLPSLRTKFGWTNPTLQRFAPIWDAIPKAEPPAPLVLRQQTLQWGPHPTSQHLPPPQQNPYRTSLPYLTHPLGRTYFVPTQGYETLHIPVHAMLVIPHHLTHPDNRPPTLSYRIARRTSLQTRQTQEGTEIAVTFWHELRKDSDIWYSPTPREARGRHRLVPITGCAVLTGSLLPTSRAQRLKFIPWTDTAWTNPRTHITHKGENNRTIIASTTGQTTHLVPNATGHQPPPQATPACTACHRLADTNICRDCGGWHHPACIPHCRVVPHHSTPTYGLHTLPRRDVRTHAVGDGSVTHQGTPAAHGTWSYMGRDGTTLAGSIQVHANHITPTRCELHSLLVGLQHSGDAALQICDNTKAIGLVVLARSLKRRGGLPRYSNIYRVELRSLMALFTDNGTFAGDWTRAHQDPDDTTDPTIRTKRLLLAEADSLATLAHQLLPLTNYAHLIIPDSWELRDEHDRPVTGATAPWLGAVYGRRDWPKVQARKPDTRRTVQPLRLPTGDICKWDPPALNFYWRAICYTLHTNARKHRIQPRWEAHCRTCPDLPDTQEHRFGLTTPTCPKAVALSQHILLATQAVLPQGWLPDQDIYIPGHGTTIAQLWPGPKRPQWKTRGGHPSPNTGMCMIPLTAHRCATPTLQFGHHACLRTQGYLHQRPKPPYPLEP